MIDIKDYPQDVEGFSYSCLDNYERLQQEFNKYRSSIGRVRNHSKMYLLCVSVEIQRRIDLLQQMADDEYHSVAAALTWWADLLQQVNRQLHLKR